uniref:Aspartic proteinase nepenthesin-1 n=2 Tax=Cajanus cajan TaxID=3821 RepID=A0A151REE8_CAJCA|nr:Aspartic proteinase nepenthesin-1 [Cajanus cajan]
MIHRDSSKSPFYRHTETQFQRVANVVSRSINRANHLHKRSRSPNTIEATVTPDQEGDYLMSYSVGTPPFQLFGIIDTGSDLVWLQCQPCKSCYNQTTPIFNPSKSKTYKTLPCNSTTCKSAGASCSNDSRKTCEYSIIYGDKSLSQGDLSVETLSLGSTNGHLIQFPRTVIGCGYDNTVSFEGKTSGIVGLGLGPVSLVSQLKSSIRGKFSYCLTPMYSQSNSSSKLHFGDAAVVSGKGTISTPMVFQEVFYFLTLEAFSVGNKRIVLRGSSSRPSRKGNIIIDSGTTLTLLPKDVYSKLESAVADAVKLERAKDPSHELSLCYKVTSDELDVPVITAHFNGADVKLNAINTFLQVADGVVCFAFMSSPIGPIFGNLAQQNFLVGYDLEKKMVSFKPMDCTKQ